MKGICSFPFHHPSRLLVPFGLILLMTGSLMITAPASADVVIDSARTEGVNLAAENGAETKKAYVTSTGSVTSSGSYTLWGKTAGWNVNVAAGSTVASTGKSSTAINFNLYASNSLINALDGSVSNSGTISSTGYAVIMRSGSVTNNAGGTIRSKYNGVSAEGDLTLDNSGTINSDEGNAIFMKSSGHIINRAGGTLSANGLTRQSNSTVIDGWNTSKNVTVDNSGKIEASNASPDGFSRAIYLPGTGNKLYNDQGGTISGKWGVSLGADSQIENEGKITADYNAVDVDGGYIHNTGTIYGGQRGVYGGNDGTVVNDGTIGGGSSFAVVVMKQGLVINNETGTLTGKEVGTVWAWDNSTVINKGLISGLGGWGVVTFNGMSGSALYNAATGVIQSVGEFNPNITYAAVRFWGEGNDLVDNAGTITAEQGPAITMGEGDDTVILRSGSKISGSVDGDDADDTDPELVNGTADRIFLDGSGGIAKGSIVNFEYLTKTGAGTWTVDGDFKDAKMIRIEDGLLNIKGKTTFGSGSTYRPTLRADGTFAHIVSDTAVIDPGATVSLDPRGLKHGVRYRIIDTTNGLTGTFDSVGMDYGLSDARVYYDACDAYIMLRSALIRAALTRNERAVSAYLDGAWETASGDLLSVFDSLHTLDYTEARAAFNRLGGASHTAYPAIDAVKHAAFFRSLFPQDAPSPENAAGAFSGDAPPIPSMGGSTFSEAVLSLADAAGRITYPFGLWIRGYGARGNRDGEDIASRYGYTVRGFVTGVDLLVRGGFRTGVALGYSKTDVDFPDLGDSGKEESLQAALYGTWRSGRWYADGGLSCTRNGYDTTRSVSFGTVSRTATASYGGYELGASVEGGYKASLGGFEITPLASVLALRHHRSAFTETGAESLNLEAEAEDATFLQGALGIQLARTFTVGESFSLTPRLSARWVHEFGNDETVLNARFAGADAGSFTVYSDTIDRNSGVFSLGLTGKLTDAFSFSLAWAGELKSRQTGHAVTIDMRYIW
ncbi:MAG: hypothetical protein CVU61_05480 [Deltaproteobacteria bacterium HGW-Deltaproteobacteria-19]|nr:MAG: hypothetical protein CVU61_05480 [Deltaproteobacteria bacterium HGW-Deltaproteobacteria-19]